MFSHIRTSKENKEVVTQLTNKLNLGAENVIARLAIAYSLEKGEKLNVQDLGDSSGKEYSRSVLLGEYEQLYLGMICSMYGLYFNDKDIPKYLKLHLDSGLKSLNTDSNSFLQNLL